MNTTWYEKGIEGTGVLARIVRGTLWASLVRGAGPSGEMPVEHLQPLQAPLLRPSLCGNWDWNRKRKSTTL